MKKQMLSFLVLLLPSLAGAYDIEIDKVLYNCDATTKTATVTYQEYKEGYGDINNVSTGEITIPSEIQYEDDTYRVTSIGRNAFSSCSSLTSVTIPNSVKSIGTEAFSSCSGLTSVTIEGMASIGNYAFSGCSSLASVTIPDGVTGIGDGAFDGCSGLTSVTIPNSVKSIGFMAFNNCSGLTSITIPNSVTSIGGYVFNGCSGLTSVIIPNSVKSIGLSAFGDCTCLTSVTIPNSVKSIGEFAFDYCFNLTSVTIDKSEPITISDDVFPSQASATLYVPKGSLAAYNVADVWKDFKEIKEIVIGDVNDDGVVDGKDLQAMIGRIMDKKPEGVFREEKADVNRDDKVDVGDVVYLIKLMGQNKK